MSRQQCSGYGFFVSGSGTGVGKTVVSAALTLALEADYFKPLQSGCLEDDDTAEVARLTGLDSTHFHAPRYRLREPLCPHEAAAREGVEIAIQEIALPQTSRPLIVEGAGGLFVPLDAKHCLIDLIERLELPVILAADSGLGTINHTLLSLNALRERGLEVAGVALCGKPNPYNKKAIEERGQVKVVCELPRLTPLEPQKLAQVVAELGLRETLRSLLGEPKAKPDVVAMDLAHVWHPFTQAQTMPRPLEISRAKGAWLSGAKGEKILDLISSWWLCQHGHSHPRLAAALARQARRMEHVIFANFTHEPAARLASELAGLLPGDLSRIFYSDNGSTAVEVALKIALQYARNTGQTKRKRLAAFQGGYHGDTVGAMSVGYSCGFYKGFEDITFEVEFLPYPATWEGDNEVEAKEALALAKIKDYLDKYPEEVAGVIIEPLVQGSAGMRMCSPRFLAKAAQLIQASEALFIFDEVMTGFGRTGSMFACEQAKVVPDVICLGKSLTGGFLPLAATACSEKIYQAFLDESFEKALAHGHSYAGNPLGCAVGLASLELMREDKALERVAQIEALHRREMTILSELPCVEHARVRGSIAALDLKNLPSVYAGKLGEQLKKRFLDEGLLIRPLGNVLYILPPYCVSDAELGLAYTGLARVLRELAG